MSNLYSRIEQLCKENGMTITTMCKQAGVSRASLSDLKMGRNQTLSSDTLAKISDLFNVTINYLLNGLPANVYECLDDENPWEVDLLDAFQSLDIDDQIYISKLVSGFAKNPDKKENSPSEYELTEGEKQLIELFRLIPEDQQRHFLEMGRAYANSLKKG